MYIEVTAYYLFVKENNGLVGQELPCYTTAKVTTEALIYKLLSLNYFMLFALNGLYCFHKKLSIISSIDLKRLLRT